MLSTLLPAALPARDAELIQRLEEEVDLLTSDGSGTLYRFAIANDAGELYRTVLVFGLEKRNRVLLVLRELGYRDGGPRPARPASSMWSSFLKK